MKLAPETRQILKQYKEIINNHRLENDKTALKTEQIIDEICDYMIHQHTVYICGQLIKQR